MEAYIITYLSSETSKHLIGSQSVEAVIPDNTILLHKSHTIVLGRSVIITRIRAALKLIVFAPVKPLSRKSAASPGLNRQQVVKHLTMVQGQLPLKQC